MNVLIVAHTIRTGGGVFLLQELVRTMPENSRLVVNAELQLVIQKNKQNVETILIKRPSTIFGRIWSEWQIYRNSKNVDIIICFHGVPVFNRGASRQIIYLHNKLLIDESSLSKYSIKVRLRIAVERFLLSFKAKNVASWYVQTLSMRYKLEDYLGKRRVPYKSIAVLPFLPSEAQPTDWSRNKADRSPSFFYPSFYQPHKNHINLVLSWCLLFKDKVIAELKLTLDDEEFTKLKSRLPAECQDQIRLKNLGVLTEAEVVDEMALSTAVIYPSINESFGLPLVRAKRFGKPIIAPELDYVRDVCVPAETFDPKSPLSIARAIKRFLSISEQVSKTHDGEVFWEEILSKCELGKRSKL